MKTTSAAIFLCLFLYVRFIESYSLEMTVDESNALSLLFDGTYRLVFSSGWHEALNSNLCWGYELTYRAAFFEDKGYYQIYGSGVTGLFEFTPDGICTCDTLTFPFIGQQSFTCTCHQNLPEGLKSCYPYTPMPPNNSTATAHCPFINVWWIGGDSSCPEPEAIPSSTNSTLDSLEADTTPEESQTTAGFYMYESTSIPTSEDTANSDDQTTPNISAEEQGGGKGNNFDLAIVAGVSGAVTVIAVVTCIFLYIIMGRKTGNTEDKKQLSPTPTIINVQPNRGPEATSFTDRRHATSQNNKMAADCNYGYAEYTKPGNANCSIVNDGMTRVDP